MKTIFSLFLLCSFTCIANAQIKVSNDSIFVQDTLRGRYGFSASDGPWFGIDVIQYKPYEFSRADRKTLESLIREELVKRNLLNREKPVFYYLSKKAPKQNVEDSESNDAGELIATAGRRFNGAILMSFLGSAGGTALVFAGFPIGGAIVTLGGGLVSLFLYIDGNSKLIKGGEALRD